MICYYLNVHFQDQRVNYINVFVATKKFSPELVSTEEVTIPVTLLIVVSVTQN